MSSSSNRNGESGASMGVGGSEGIETMVRSSFGMGRGGGPCLGGASASCGGRALRLSGCSDELDLDRLDAASAFLVLCRLLACSTSSCHCLIKSASFFLCS